MRQIPAFGRGAGVAGGEDGSIRITAPEGRAVYVDGNYEEPRPKKIPCVLLAELGRTTLETLTDDRKIDYRAVVELTPEDPSKTVELAKVRSRKRVR